MLFIEIQPDGTLTEHEVTGETYPVMRAAVQGLIEPIDWKDNLVSYHNEEFLYAEGEVFEQVNLAVALMGDIKVYGPVIFTGGTDDEGETTGLSAEDAQGLRTLAASVREDLDLLRIVFQSPRSEVDANFTITSWPL